MLGLVRRDLLLDMASAVAREDAAAVFQLADRAVESGYELRTVLRELGRLVRDLLVISIDPSRLSDPRDRGGRGAGPAEGGGRALLARRPDAGVRCADEGRGGDPQLDAAALSSRDDAAALDPPAQAGSASDLIEGLDRGHPARRAIAGPRARPPCRAVASGGVARASSPSAPRPGEIRRSAPPAKASAGKPVETSAGLPAVEPVPPDRFKDAFLEEIRKAKKFFYGTVIAQAQKIHVEGDRVVITFAPQHRALRSQLEQTRPHLETIASQLAGKKDDAWCRPKERSGRSGRPRRGGRPACCRAADGKKAALREQAMADSGVQAMLDVFAAEIKDVEEM